MGTTVRLPPQLHAEVMQAAERLGISFNALVAVALVDYLAARPSVRTPTPGGIPPKVTPAARAAHKRKRRR